MPLSSRRHFLKNTAALFSTTLMSGISQAKSSKRPNIIFILADDLGWMDTGCYGSTYYQTPNIDSLAKSGMRFTDAYSANPLCSPTRASILTGQYPARLRLTAAAGHLSDPALNPKEKPTAAAWQRATVPESAHWLSLDYTSFADHLKKTGYATAFMGKWHLGDPPHCPENFGFDIVRGGRRNPGPPAPGRFFTPWNIDTLPKVPEGSHICDVLTDEALQFIDQKKENPFLLCLWYYDVHAPFQAKDKLIEKHKSRVDGNNSQQSPTMAAMIETMDQNIGRVLTRLKDHGIDDNTIIVFSSDNGGNMYDVTDNTTPTNNSPLRSGKGNNYEGGVRVPLIVQWPGMVKEGTINESVVSSVDFYPTLLQMAGLPLSPDDHLDGISFIPALKGESHNRGPILSHFPHSVPATNNRPNTTVRDGVWKLFRFWWDNPDQTHRYELYNLNKDIGETRNLAVKHPEIVKKLDAFIKEYCLKNDVLIPQKNKQYDGNTAGVWHGNADARVESNDGELRVEAKSDNAVVNTTTLPSVSKEAVLKLEVKGDRHGQINIEWWQDRNKKDNGYWSEHIEIKKPGIWQPVTIKMKFENRIKNLSFKFEEKGIYTFRYIEMYTPGNTRIRQWRF